MKDPAFLFYSQDFYTGVATLTMEERGKYITLLCLMHQQGRMTEETISFLVGSISVNLKSKFKIDENGFWFNERLEIESEKRAKFTESRRTNGFKGGRPKNEEKPNGKANKMHMDNHMENENENENVNDNNNEDVIIYSEDFLKFWEAYPRKEGKDYAFKCWQRKKGKPSLSEIIAKIELQKKTDQWQDQGGKFIPQPSKYINQGYWNDEIKKPGIIKPSFTF